MHIFFFFFAFDNDSPTRKVFSGHPHKCIFCKKLTLVIAEFLMREIGEFSLSLHRLFRLFLDHFSVIFQFDWHHSDYRLLKLLNWQRRIPRGMTTGCPNKFGTTFSYYFKSLSLLDDFWANLEPIFRPFRATSRTFFWLILKHFWDNIRPF